MDLLEIDFRFADYMGQIKRPARRIVKIVWDVRTEIRNHSVNHARNPNHRNPKVIPPGSAGIAMTIHALQAIDRRRQTFSKFGHTRDLRPTDGIRNVDEGEAFAGPTPNRESSLGKFLPGSHPSGHLQMLDRFIYQSSHPIFSHGRLIFRFSIQRVAAWIRFSPLYLFFPFFSFFIPPLPSLLHVLL
jgi:hypothetical protein